MKIWNYVFVSITMMLILTFLGFNTGFNSIFNLIGFQYTPSTGEIGNVTTSASNVYNILFGNGSDISGILLALLVAGGAIIVGLSTKLSTENLILLPFITGTLVLFVQTFVHIMNYAVGNFPTWASAVILVFFIPFTIGYIVALAEMFRGTD
jgi:hypothetical protein